MKLVDPLSIWLLDNQKKKLEEATASKKPEDKSDFHKTVDHLRQFKPGQKLKPVPKDGKTGVDIDGTVKLGQDSYARRDGHNVNIVYHDIVTGKTHSVFVHKDHVKHLSKLIDTDPLTPKKKK